MRTGKVNGSTDGDGLWVELIENPAIIITAEWEDGREEIGPLKICSTMQPHALAWTLRYAADSIDGRSTADEHE